MSTKPLRAKPRVQTPLYLPQDVAERITEMARRDKVSRNTLIAGLVEAAVRRDERDHGSPVDAA